MKRIVYFAMLMFSIVLLGSCSKENVEPSDPIVAYWHNDSTTINNVKTTSFSDRWEFEFTSTTVREHNILNSNTSEDAVYKWTLNNTTLNFFDAIPTWYEDKQYTIIVQPTNKMVLKYIAWDGTVFLHYLHK